MKPVDLYGDEILATAVSHNADFVKNSFPAFYNSVKLSVGKMVVWKLVNKIDNVTSIYISEVLTLEEVDLSLQGVNK